MDEVVSLITNVGFPIAMCVCILYWWNTRFNTQMDKLSEAVSQLTIAVEKLLTKMDADDES